MNRPIRVLASTLAVALLTGATATTAAAGPLLASAASCESQTLSQPFLPWADPMQYTLAPGGDFESDPWTATGAASVVDGNESFHVGGLDDSRSLSVPAGSAATSAAMCVGVEHPTVRFFARQTGGSSGASLEIEVLFEDGAGGVHSVPFASTGAGASWAPSAPHPIFVNLLALMPGEHTPVAFRVTAQGGDFQVDDFYVDPYNRG